MVGKEKQIHSTRVKPHVFLKREILQGTMAQYYMVNTP